MKILWICLSLGFCFVGCKTSPDTVAIVTDVGLALVVANNPAFAPYASDIADLVRDENLTPDALDKAVDAYLATQVESEDLVAARAVLTVLKASYRRYYRAEAAPESLADDLTRDY